MRGEPKPRKPIEENPVRVGVRAGDGRKLLDQVAQGQFAGFLDRGAIDGYDRIGSFNVDATDIRTRYGDRFQLLTALVLRRVLGQHRTG